MNGKSLFDNQLRNIVSIHIVHISTLFFSIFPFSQIFPLSFVVVAIMCTISIAENFKSLLIQCDIRSVLSSLCLDEGMKGSKDAYTRFYSHQTWFSLIGKVAVTFSHSEMWFPFYFSCIWKSQYYCLLPAISNTHALGDEMKGWMENCVGVGRALSKLMRLWSLMCVRFGVESKRKIPHLIRYKMGLKGVKILTLFSAILFFIHQQTT